MALFTLFSRGDARSRIGQVINLPKFPLRHTLLDAAPANGSFINVLCVRSSIG